MGIAGIVRQFPTVLCAIHRYPAPEIRMTTEDGHEERGGSVLLANVGAMAFGGTAVDSADPFDGQLDVLTFPPVGTARVAGLALRMIVSSLETARGVTHRPATHVRLESKGDVPFQLDGEPVGTLPVEVRLLPGAIRLLLT
jgi:diacylglycerol kinase family enzyme